MIAKEFAKVNGISYSKVKKMAPYINGATKCPCCKRWNIPDTARPIYIPDKRKYSLYTKKYCYVLDAIALGMELNPQLSLIDKETCKTILKELYKYDLIINKDESNLDDWYHLDFVLSIKLLDWQVKKASEKSKIISDTIINCAKTITEALQLTKRLITL